ncbi:hypothetical protein U1555_21060, partial [Aeromonas caviae]|uniref:transposase n=1 Tax=Aeromonas caviae TaxID=648 RepID=UPI0030147775
TIKLTAYHRPISICFVGKKLFLIFNKMFTISPWATACIPPRKNAGLWEKGHPRNEAVLVMRKEGLAHWKKISGYHRRSLAETAMYRFKQLLAGRISLRNYNGQVGEVMAYVSAINKLNTLGLPVRKPRV